MKKTRINQLLALAVLLSAAMGSMQAQRPLGDTLLCPSMDTTYYYYNDDWPAVHESDDGNISTTYDLGLSYLGWVSGHVYGIAYWPAVNPHAPYTPGSSDVMNLMMDYRLFGNKIVGNHMVADRPLRVVGIAACGHMQPAADTILNYHYGYYVNYSIHFPNTVDTTLAGRATDSLRLYKIAPGGPQYLTGGPWRVEYPHLLDTT